MSLGFWKSMMMLYFIMFQAGVLYYLFNFIVTAERHIYIMQEITKRGIYDIE